MKIIRWRLGMSFGQHQTFYLRQQWLTKGLTEVSKNSRFFYEQNHFEVLGVGKNMAKSIRHWLNATQLIKEQRSTKTEMIMTDLAEIIFKYDPYVKSKHTLYILHYLLVTEKNEATTWYWFFNVFNEKVFTKQILLDKLKQWTNENLTKEVSENSLKRDIDCLIQLYTAKDYKNHTPEDVIKSPLEVLNLITQTTGTHYIKSNIDKNPSISILYICLLKYLEKHEQREVSLKDLLQGDELWGKVFNLNRDTIIMHLEDMQKYYPIIFTRTNHLDVIRIEDSSWMDKLKVTYEKEVLI